MAYTVIASAAAAGGVQPFGERGARAPLRPRLALVAGALVAMMMALLLTRTANPNAVDPALVTLLRGMALLKALLVMLAGAAVWWRLQWPLGRNLVAVYFGGVWLAAASAVLIWNLTLIALAAAAFHCGGLAVLIAAWRDDGARPRRAAGAR